MLGLFRRTPHQSQKHQRDDGEWFSVSFSPENFIPGLIIGFLFGLFLDLTKLPKNNAKGNKLLSKVQLRKTESNCGDEELKMVLIVRQDLKMGMGKIASQCAHAATGIYAEMMQSQRSLLRQWEQCGQPKIVLSCKNQQEMNKLKEAAESIGLPTFVVADAGRTQVLAGSKTVLAIGPGRKSSVDSVTGKLRLL
ncbi:PREDICTED: peptidyl-tRNA hydrolase 2, mitochondrial [Nelumbo nucifera]|uniref:peptidyl-tRNA hydrolase n=1 Tax=Nelumbo nucifera TaxID=4432 RepID=A0A1U7ZQ17_NELNU|nr:PREDICTED: peptidyl-tRNA hydrolase 2, mitochondrial [Nelumbo nucifera]